MTRPESTINTLLNTINGILVYQVRPEVLEQVYTTVTVVFSVRNIPEYTLDNDISHQSVQVTIDVYGKNSKATGTVMNQIEPLMRNAGYRMIENRPISPIEKETYSQLNLQFEGII